MRLRIVDDWGMAGETTRQVVVGAGGTFTLTVEFQGTGTGTVASLPAGIDACGGPTCSATFPAGTRVYLEATPGAGSTFGTWSGVDQEDGNTAHVTLTSDRTVILTLHGDASPIGPGG